MVSYSMNEREKLGNNHLMNLHTLSILLNELSGQLWPWKPFHLVGIIACGPVSLCGTPPPWLKWQFSRVLFSTGTVLGLYYLVHLYLGSVLQAESDEGLVDQIFGKCFWMLQYESWFLVDCHLSVPSAAIWASSYPDQKKQKTGKCCC